MSPETIAAVAELLQAAEQYNVPVAFVPEDVGWNVLQLLDWPAHSDDNRMCWGTLASSYDLETSAKAALRPLIELGGRWLEYHSPRTD